MNEALRHEIVQQHQAGLSQRAIAHALGISRKVVRNVLARLQAQRDGEAPSLPRPRRGSIIDAYEPILKELLARYPNLTVERAVQELQARGFRGRYTTVRQRVGLLRPRLAPAPVQRFETDPGLHYVKQSAMFSISAGPELWSVVPAVCFTYFRHRDSSHLRRSGAILRDGRISCDAVPACSKAFRFASRSVCT